MGDGAKSANGEKLKVVLCFLPDNGDVMDQLYLFSWATSFCIVILHFFPLTFCATSST